MAKTHQEGTGRVHTGCSPGNSPELMPWDTSLNKDVDDCVSYSTRLSRHNLREQASAYKRGMDPALGIEKGAPTSNRICQDIRKFILALTGIRDAHGICVQGFGSRAGNCRKWPGKAWRQAREESRNRRPAVPL